MCFQIINEYPNEKISQEPIKCYKVVRDLDSFDTKIPLPQFRSILYDDRDIPPYALGEIYTARNEHREIESLKEVPFGQHAMTVHEGFHSFKYLDGAMFNKHNRDTIVECEIPPNTPYYENDSEFVSLKIMFKEIK